MDDHKGVVPGLCPEPMRVPETILQGRLKSAGLPDSERSPKLAMRSRSRRFAHHTVTHLKFLEEKVGMSNLPSEEWGGGFLNDLNLPLGCLRSRPVEALDLCAGVGSVSRVLQLFGYTTHSLDVVDRPGINILVDLLDWDFDTWLFNHIQGGGGIIRVVWASPPCNNFSAMRVLPGRVPPKDKEFIQSISLVKKSLEIFYKIDLLSNLIFGHQASLVIENPATGLMSSLRMLDPFFHNVTSYCWYETGPSPDKPTVFCNNILGLEVKPRCRRGAKGCGKAAHKSCLQMTSEQLYHIPLNLLKEIFSALPTSWHVLACPFNPPRVPFGREDSNYPEGELLDSYAREWVKKEFGIKMPNSNQHKFGPDSQFDSVVSDTLNQQWFYDKATKVETEILNLVWGTHGFEPFVSQTQKVKMVKDSCLSQEQLL